ncbi:hypothetical protein MATL_G00158390 [Megalops atlanticus]|uniref:Rho-GAP domain-containing protein n=1 Tax=Megalops atlanticus TaxID=7932 RepID=A0A9D3T1C2_MEGAT|nr:hypothetical protein MATL_G00158390 [Megalops atlanticus]
MKMLSVHTEGDAKTLPPSEEVCNAEGGTCQPCENGGANRWRNLILRLQKKSCSTAASDPDSRTQLFGQPLSSICDRDQRLPKPIRDVLSELWRRGPATEGVFRKAGSSKRLTEIKAQLNSGVHLATEDQPVTLLADLLKDFLRQLPGGLLGVLLYPTWMRAMGMEDIQDRCAELRLVAERLPRPNILLLQQLLSVLHQVSLHADSNRMDARNLAVCIAPNLLHLDHMSLDTVKEITVLTEFLIENCCEIFGSCLQTLLKQSGKAEQANSTDSLSSSCYDSAYDSSDPEAVAPPAREDEGTAVPSYPSISRRPARPLNRRCSEPAMLRSPGMRTLLKLARSQCDTAFEQKDRCNQNSHDSLPLPHCGQRTAIQPLRRSDSLSSSCYDSAYDSPNPEAVAREDEGTAAPSCPSNCRRPARPLNRRCTEPAMLRSPGMRTLLKLARGHGDAAFEQRDREGPDAEEFT